MPGKRATSGAGVEMYADPRVGYSMTQPGPSGGYYTAAENGGYTNGTQSMDRVRKPASGVDVGLGAADERTYLVNHLVTWTVGPENGVLTHEDGMRQLSRMDQAKGILPMRCVISVQDQAIHVLDSRTAEVMEQIPLENIQDPVAVRDRSGLFNNLTLFTVKEDARNQNSPSEMHIFHVLEKPAAALADDIADAKMRHPSRSTRALKPQISKSGKQLVNRQRAESYGNLQISVQDAINKFELTKAEHEEPSRPKPREQFRARRLADVEGDSEDDIKKGVALLNRCFDEIEQFILRLKQSGKAFQELNKRKKHSKGGKRLGDGMLTMRSKAPTPAEFVECLQKFKLCFNILARLKKYLHNPNSAELIHFLFTPLSLLVEASGDPRFDLTDLVKKVVTPLLTADAVELLNNCLTSREYDFWMSLGEAWRTPREKWTHGSVMPYKPRFSDDWQPSESWLEMFLGYSIGLRAAEQAKRISNRDQDEQLPLPPTSLTGADEGDIPRLQRRQSNNTVSPVSPRRPDISSPPFTDRSVPDRPENAYAVVNKKPNLDEYQKNFIKDLQQKNAKIYEVVQDRKGNNPKELTIHKGEVVEVVDDTRNWWKCSNINGDVGFIPYTLLRAHESAADTQVAPDYMTGGGASGAQATAIPVSVTPVPAPSPPPPPPPPAVPPPNNIDSVTSLNSNWSIRKPTPPQSKAEPAKPAADTEVRVAGNQAAQDFSSELKQRLSRINLNESQNSRNLAVSMSAQVFIDQHSTPEEVASWLKKKGFQDYTQHMLSGYNGSELFHLSNDALLSEFGQQEGARLVSQLKLMKTTAGYTHSGSSQLRKILEQRKQRAENGDRVSQNSDVMFDLDDSADLTSASATRNSARRY